MIIKQYQLSAFEKIDFYLNATANCTIIKLIIKYRGGDPPNPPLPAALLIKLSNSGGVPPPDPPLLGKHPYVGDMAIWVMWLYG